MSLTHTGDTKQMSLLRTREGAKPSPRTLTKTLPEVNQSMNEEEAEEQANFLKGICKALDDLNADMERIVFRMQNSISCTEGNRASAKELSNNIKAYFELEEK